MSDSEKKNTPLNGNGGFDAEFEEILSSLKSDKYAAYLSDDEKTPPDEQETLKDESEDDNENKDQDEDENTEEDSDPEEGEELKKTARSGRLHSRIKRLPKRKKIALAIIAGILAVILALGTAGLIYVQVKLGKLGGGSTVEDDLKFDDEIYDESDFSTIDADIHASSFKEGIRQWAMNGGEIMSSKNVINVLIIGYDSRKNQFTGNTDAIMLLSLNKKTKTLTLSSFLRDQYMYYETSDGKTGYNKVNAMCSIGGPDCLLKAIENHYKIQVDRYVAVNFASFKTLIDKMGGIDVTVQKYESDYYYTYFHTTIPYGENVHLTGTQALGFCRIRKCDTDGDVSRTRRQQMVIQAIIDKISDASLLDVNNYLNVFLPYVTTNFNNSEILSLGTRAMTRKWYSYGVQQMGLPPEEARYGYSGSTWMWVVDYPLAAQALQSAVFGMTNIQLSQGRTTIIDLIHGTTGGGGASAHAKPSTTGSGGSAVTETKEATTAIVTQPSTTSVRTTETTVPTTEKQPTTQPTTTNEPTKTEPPTDTTAATDGG